MDVLTGKPTASHTRRRVTDAPEPQGRPGSAVRSQFNPITGEQPAIRPLSRGKTAKPECVPELKLGHLKDVTGVGEWNRLEIQPSLDTGRSGNTTISWGTAPSAREPQSARLLDDENLVLSHRAQSSRRGYTPTTGAIPGLDVRESPRSVLPNTQRSQYSVRSARGHFENTGPTTEKQDARDYHIEESFKGERRNFGSDQRYQVDTSVHCNNSQRSARSATGVNVTKYSAYKPYEEVDDPLQCSWGSARTAREKDKQEEAEKWNEMRQQQEMTEQVLVDQLSRHVLSDPDQDTRDMSALTHRPGMPRGAIRNLHETKLRPSSAAQSERMLARSVRFDCRMLTDSSSDAMRELTGFFFVVDGSLTIYEFKQFGKTSKTMPFINRSIYEHACGRRRGQKYSLLDIYPGAVLSFSTDSQSRLPPSVRSQLILSFKVTNVDEVAREKILLEDFPESEKHDFARGLKLPPTREQLEDMLLLQRVQQNIREQLQGRGVRTLLRLEKHLRTLDAAGDHRVGSAAALDALHEVHLHIPRSDFEALWDVLEPDGRDEVGTGDLLRALVGELPEQRRALVLKAFRKIDFRQRGSVSPEDIRKFFNGSKHPLVVSKQNSQEDVLKSFLESFRIDKESVKEISFLDFLRHYEGLSIAVEKDEDFAGILRSCWNV